MNATELRIALLQLVGCGYDRAASLARGEAACRAAAEAGADIALFPELWSTGYAFIDGDLTRWRAQAIARDDQWVRAFSGLAAELHMAIVVRMKYHAPTQAYVARRTAEGKTKLEIIRCLKRLLAREIWTLTRPLRTTLTTSKPTT